MRICEVHVLSDDPIKLGVADDFTVADVEERDRRWVVIPKGDGTSTMFSSTNVVRINIYDELLSVAA